jgi:signal transduction histidine kinase
VYESGAQAEDIRTDEAFGRLARFNQGVIDSLPANLCVLGERGVIVAVNRAWREFAKANLGRSEALGPGTNYLAACDVVEGDDRETALKAGEGIRSVISGRSETFVLEYPCDSPCVSRWFELRATRFVDGGWIHAVVTHTDVTNRKRVEREILALNTGLEHRVEERTAELRRTIQELEGFSYTVSHDLRAPLRAIDGFSAKLELESGQRLDEEGRRLVGIVRRDARRMGRLIDDLLEYSRANRHPCVCVPVPMEPLVRSVWAEVLPAEDDGRSDLVVGALPEAWCDPTLIRRVVLNLLSNAVKFSETAARRHVEVSGRERDGGTEYLIRDNGVGFDMAYGEKIFGVFEQLETAGEYDGTGIGLALVKRLVERLGGTVSASSQLGAGAEIGFWIPGRPSG